MGRDIRYILPNSLQHVVDVVSQSRFLLCPSAEVNERYLGVLGRAQKKYDMTICAAVVLSNHMHLLLRPRDGAHLADFMCFLKTNLAKEIGGRIRGWKGHFFDQRYRSIPVSDEEAAQMGALRYVLSNGVKEFLVDKVRQWPGVHSAASMIDGTSMVGRWYDRSAEYAARIRRGETEVKSEDFASEQAVRMSPLPCWEHLTESVWRRSVKDMVDDIDREVAIERQTQGKTSLGVTKIMAQDPYERPDGVNRSPKPRFHAFDREVFEMMLGAWRTVVEAFYEAAELLRAGLRDVEFPEGTFPPSLPFVPFGSAFLGARGDPG